MVSATARWPTPCPSRWPCHTWLSALIVRAHSLAHVNARLQAAAAPKYYVLQYSYVPDMMQKRDPHRQAHLDAIKQWVRCEFNSAAS